MDGGVEDVGAWAAKREIFQKSVCCMTGVEAQGAQAQSREALVLARRIKGRQSNRSFFHQAIPFQHILWETVPSLITTRITMSKSFL